MSFVNHAGRIAGNTVNSVVENTREAVMTFGKAALHTLAPDNFEYYMCSLELLDSYGYSKGFIYFAVMPDNILENRTQIATITKTNKGVSTLFNDTFVPRDISIQGTFGRKFRLLLGMKESENVSSIPYFSGNLGINVLENDTLIKTGYGLTKMLKNMIESSTKLDDMGNPCVLIFNNYALNTHYVVEVMQDSYSQSVENNMIWYYSLEMKAVAPADAVKRKENKNVKFLTSVASNSIAKSISNILKDISRSSLGSLNIGV